MSEFARIEPVQSDKIFQIGRFHLAGVGQAWKTWVDAVIDEVTIHGKAQQPAVIVRLIRGFLQRLPLPRLLHYLDLVLPQMVPVCSPVQTAGFQFPGSQLIRVFFFLLYAAWVRSRAERPSVSYTKVVMEVAWTGHNLQFTKTN